MSTTRGQHLIGKMLGSYVLEKLLGYGGSSAVFLAQQQDSDRKAAVKVFLPRSTMDAQTRKEFFQRFLREAEAASQMDHPNILPIYSYGEQDSLPYIIMPYMAGGTLSEYVAKFGSLSLQDAQWYLEQIASALDYVHKNGCIHCDVKPANILIDDDGHVMLSDFGIAHLAKDEKELAMPRNPDALMGTPDYISPEQAMGRPIDGRTDIYSLGVTVFYLLAGQLPFIADTSIALALMHVHEQPPALASVRADISPVLDQVIHTALAKQPEQRFQTATSFSNAFTDAVTEALTVGEQTAVVCKAGTSLLEKNRLLARLLPSLATVDAMIAGDTTTGPRFTRKHLLGATSLLLVVVLVSVFSLSYVVAQFSGKTKGEAQLQTANSISPPQRNSADLLSDPDLWPTSPTLFFDQQTQSYHIANKSPQNVLLISLYRGDTYSNFQLSVLMEELHGPDEACYYGVVFRSASDQSKYYIFEVLTASGEEFGKYAFWRYDGAGKLNLLANGNAPALLKAKGKSNKLMVKAQGNHFSFTINDKAPGMSFVDPSKSALKLGQIGLYVEARGSEVAFSQLHVTPLKA
jgi:serine/threonine protein kinase